LCFLWPVDQQRSKLFGVGRVAAFEQVVGGVPQLLAYNWDGLRRLWTGRCPLGVNACTFDSQDRLESPNWNPEGYPAGPPAALAVDATTSVLVFGGGTNRLVRQVIQNGAAGSPAPASWTPANTLRPGIGVGAAYDAGWGGPWFSRAVVAFVCDTPTCSCAGTTPTTHPFICASRFDASAQSIVRELPVGLGTAEPKHAPALVATNSGLLAIWVEDSSESPPTSRVFWSNLDNPGGAWQWSSPTAWLTAGEIAGVDFPAQTGFPIAAALLRGASSPTMFDDDLSPRVYLQYHFKAPSNDPKFTGEPARAFIFASALRAAGGALQQTSMGVAQNYGPQLTLGLVVESATGALHGPAGAFVSTSAHVYALVRLAKAPTEPAMPDYGLAPVPGYGPLTIKSVDWR